jgi:D-alanyl-D-alanine carboxypeptidase
MSAASRRSILKIMKNFFIEKKTIIYHILFIFLGIISSTIFFKLLEIENFNKKNLIEKQKHEQEVLKEKEKEKKQKEDSEEKKDIFGNLRLTAKSFLIFDLENNKEIFSKNKNKKTGIASLTKIATVDVFLKNLDQKNKVQIVLENLKEEGDNGIYNKESFNYLDAINLMMIASSNDMASALTNNLGKKKFILKMNQLAEELKMNSTLFFSESGLDLNQDVSGAYSSPNDLLKLIKYFYKKYPKISKEFSVKNKKICSDLLCHDLKNTNILFSQKENFPFEILFSKTGYTKKTGGGLAMILNISGRKFVVIILSSTKEGRFEDMKIVAHQLKYFLEK